MIIISHRGYWKVEKERNLKSSFERSFSLGFGTETDIRDYCGELVISHDIADANAMSAEDFFKTYKNYKNQLPLALNIKSDGLQKKLKYLLEKYNVKNYFVFDMSIPDTLGYLDNGLNVYTRHSEYEPNPPLYQQSTGVWIDGFLSDWLTEEVLVEHLNNGKKIAIVSPDLHKRSYINFWEKLKSMQVIKSDEIILCTDKPEEALGIFDEK